MKAKIINFNYVKTSFQKILNESKEHFLYKNILVYQKDPLPREIDINKVLLAIERQIPQYLVADVDDIFIGNFKEFKERNINAFYKDGALYITNKQSSNEDLIDDIVHEFAHAVEDKYGLEIYSDGSIEEEFLHKRKILYFRLSKMGYDNLPKYLQFVNTEYSTDFDEFLYKGIGYEKLYSFMSDIFPTMYSITSLEEYFAEGFSEYFLNEKVKVLKSLCPRLVNKLIELQDME